MTGCIRFGDLASYPPEVRALRHHNIAPEAAISKEQTRDPAADRPNLAARGEPRVPNGSRPSSAFQPEDEAIVGRDLDIVILNEPLCAHHSFAVVPANECFDFDAAAVFRDPA